MNNWAETGGGLLRSLLVLAAATAIAPGTEAQTRGARNAAPALRTDPIEVGFSSIGQTVSRGEGSVRVRIELSRPAPREVSIPIEVSSTNVFGRDYTADLEPVKIAAGATSGAVIVDLFDTDAGDDDDTIAITINPGSLGNGLQGLGLRSRHLIRVTDKELGDPIDGITLAQKEAFERGLEVFNRRFTPSEGLGPFYNATSCASCHSTPVPGGTSDLYRNFFLAVYQFGPTPVSQSSAVPPFLSQVVPAFGSGDNHGTTTEFTLEGPRPDLPATVFGFPVLAAQRNAIPAFGAGLFENVSDATIMSNADPFDTDANGISGRINTQLSGAAIGRLGLKAQANNIELFTRGPLQNQMGITSNPFEGSSGIVSLSRLQVAADPNDPSQDVDPVPDPEISHQDLGDLIAFGKFLAPPTKKPFNAAALNGETLFASIGCTDCHIPSLPSSRGPVNAYTDLLIHYMGEDLADKIKLGDSNNSVDEFRTQPLWGVSHFSPYMHDGRADTLAEAIDIHAGEAQASRDAFTALSSSDQADIIAFLEHL